ncbi:MAG TPA: MAPEG family protein [Stellaceae bacterium]|nr:MAPEG family protein [Stellaceae bacterium]
MPLAYWMILAAAFLPYVTVALAKSGGVDNRAPRRELQKLEGWRQRADWAHRNHFETFPIFAASVLVAEVTHAPQGRIDLLALSYVAVRIVYTAMYMADLATMRSLVFTLGLGLTVWLFVASL